MGIRIGRPQGRKRGSGSLGGGCALWIVVLAIWGICALIFPKLPGYDETLERGEQVSGEVVRVENVENMTINGRNPRRVFYRYGDGREASMIMALDQRAAAGEKLKVRLLGDQAYPEGIRPLAKPGWLNAVLILGAVFGTLLVVAGVLRLLVIGGVLFAAGRSMLKKDDSPPPEDSPPPPPPGP